MTWGGGEGREGGGGRGGEGEVEGTEGEEQRNCLYRKFSETTVILLLQPSYPQFLNVWEPRNRFQGIAIPPAYVVWRAGSSNRVVVPARQAGNRFPGSSKCLQIRARAGQCDNPVPTP